MPILKEQTLTYTYGLIDALRREGRADDAATLEALLESIQREEADYLTTEEAAARVGVSHQTVIDWIRRGILPGAPLAGRLMVPAAAIDRFVEIEPFLDQLDAEGAVLSPEDAVRVVEQRRHITAQMGVDIARGD